MHAIEAREYRISISAAVLMHLLLVAALIVSLNWSRQSPKPVQAELWSSLPPIAAPSVKVTPPQPTAAPAPPAPPTKADISLQKKKADEAKKEAAQKEADRQERERREAQRKIDEQKKREEQKALARIEARRQEELARLGMDPNAKPAAKGKDLASKAGVQGGADVGAKAGELADYAAIIRAKVLAQARVIARAQAFDPKRDAPSNPEVTFTIDQLPTGEIVSIRKVKTSGVPAWDDIVEKAIQASSPLPKKKDGTVQRVIELGYKPMETRQ